LVTSILALVTLLGCEEQPRPTPPAPPSAARSAVATAPSAVPSPYPKLREKVVLSPVYEVDRVYKSMTGPQSSEPVTLTSEPELLWIVGFEAIMVEPAGRDPVSQEFMCHTNLDLDPTAHNALFSDDKPITGRLFTLSQGQYRIDLPKGFAIPILSTEVLSLNTQVLNLNMQEGRIKVRHRVVMRYLRDSELDAPMKPLFPAAGYGLKLLDGKDGHYGAEADHAQHDMEGACLPGQNASTNVFDDGKGRKFTGHWVVKPGREENHTRVTDIMALPFDTTLHYVAVHLHPFAETIELRDLTSDKTVYKARTRQAEKGIGLGHVDFFSSEKGIPLFKDHEYEVISIYHNTTSEDQDSMAVMNLYLLDHEFEKPDPSKPAEPAPAPSAPASAHAHHEHGKPM
jgi:hypothetical protein